MTNLARALPAVEVLGPRIFDKIFDQPGSEKDQTSKLGQKFLTKFLQPQDKSWHPKLGQNFCQNFCDLNPRSDVQTRANFDKTKMATPLKLPITSIFPSGIILMKKFFKTISAKKSFPTCGITRIIFCLYEFPSGITTHRRRLNAKTFSAQLSSKAKTIQVPQRNHYSKHANFALWSYHS